MLSEMKPTPNGPFFIFFLFLFQALYCCFGASPNILFIAVDDLRVELGFPINLPSESNRNN